MLETFALYSAPSFLLSILLVRLSVCLSIRLSVCPCVVVLFSQHHVSIFTVSAAASPSNNFSIMISALSPRSDVGFIRSTEKILERATDALHFPTQHHFHLTRFFILFLATRKHKLRCLSRLVSSSQFLRAAQPLPGLSNTANNDNNIGLPFPGLSRVKVSRLPVWKSLLVPVLKEV